MRTVKKAPSEIVSTVFWLSVIVSVCLSWAAATTGDNDALTIAFAAGAVGLITYLISASQEERS